MILIHIGYHKTGTTFLQKNVFTKIPNLIYLGKRDKYSSNDFLNFKNYLMYKSDLLFSEEHLKDLFDKFSYNESKKICISEEGFSTGLDWFGSNQINILIRINNLFKGKKLKVLLGIRNQKTMIPSIYSEYIKMGGVLSLKRLLFQKHQNGKYLIDKLHYFRYIESCANIFGKDNIHVFLYEDLIDRPSDTITKILKFSDIYEENLIKNIKIQSVNESPSIVVLNLIRFINNFFVSIHNRKPLISLSWPITIFGIIFIKVRSFFKTNLSNNFINWGYFEFENYISTQIHSKMVNTLIRLDNIFLKKYFPKPTLSDFDKQSINQYFLKENKPLVKYFSKSNLKKYGYII